MTARAAAVAAARRVLPVDLRRRLLLFAVRRAPYRFKLARLGAIYGTDKVDAAHTHLGKTYCDVYELYLQSRRREAFTLLEIGVYNGDSLRMWDAYFPNATICGLDIDPGSARHAPEFEVVTAAQDDVGALCGLLDRHPDLEVVVDDGSHFNEHIIRTFDVLFPRLPSGGLYLIEDIEASYSGEWHGYPQLNPDLTGGNDRADFDRFLGRLVRDCDLGGEERQVAFVHLWPSLAVVGRASRLPRTRRRRAPGTALDQARSSP
jgi:hypothetical protein